MEKVEENSNNWEDWNNKKGRRLPLLLILLNKE